MPTRKDLTQTLLITHDGGFVAMGRGVLTDVKGYATGWEDELPTPEVMRERNYTLVIVDNAHPDAQFVLGKLKATDYNGIVINADKLPQDQWAKWEEKVASDLGDSLPAPEPTKGDARKEVTEKVVEAEGGDKKAGGDDKKKK